MLEGAAAPAVSRKSQSDDTATTSRAFGNWLIPLIDLFIPESVFADPDELRRARLGVGGLVIGILAFSVMTVVQSLRGSLVIAGTVGVGVVAFASVLMIFRRSGSVAFLAHAIPCLLFVHSLVVMFTTSGRFIGSLYASASLIPMAPVMLRGWRYGLAWTLASAGATGVLLGASDWRASPMFALDPARLEASNLRGTILMAFVSLGIALSYEWLRTGAMREAQAARLELERYRRDLEERVEQRTQELDVSRRQLVEGQRLAGIGTLAAGIAHQINNPVGGILVAAQYAKSISHAAENADSEVFDALSSIETEAQRCGRIVHGLLQFARNEPTEKWAADINLVMQQAEYATRSYAREREGEVILTPCAQPAHVEINPIAFEQVLVNLIRNGLEARDEGAVVELAAELAGGVVSIFVRDNGHGIPEELRPHVFDPFFTTRTAEGGTGLGLSVSHGIIHDHGGQLLIESEPGTHTTFRVELPLCDPELRSLEEAN